MQTPRFITAGELQKLERPVPGEFEIQVPAADIVVSAADGLVVQLRGQLISGIHRFAQTEIFLVIARGNQRAVGRQEAPGFFGENRIAPAQMKRPGIPLPLHRGERLTDQFGKVEVHPGKRSTGFSIQQGLIAKKMFQMPGVFRREKDVSGTAANVA
jgi:hypothetical protein